MATKKFAPLHARNVTGRVYLTGSYDVTAEKKAKELTVLMQSLLAAGIYESATDAAKAGVAVGTFVVIDDPKTPGLDFRVEVVPRVAKAN